MNSTSIETQRENIYFIRFRGRIHFEFDKYFACEVCVRVCPIDLPIVDWNTRCNVLENICNVLENICSLIVDSGSSCNCCSVRMVEKLKLQVVPHPKPYKLQWFNELHVDKQVEIKFSIGNYKDKVLCDVVPMEACHILLGRPWQFDKKTLHDGLTNEISFTHKYKKFVLSPLPILKW